MPTFFFFLSRNVSLSRTSFDAEIPRSRTLGGIIEQYFDGSGNEVGTGSGCCQDGRAQRPASPPRKKPILTISRHTFLTLLTILTIQYITILNFNNSPLFQATLFTHLIQSFKLISSGYYPPLTTFSSVLFSSRCDGEKF